MPDHRAKAAEAVASSERNRREFWDLERAAAVDLFVERGWALVWRPGLTEPARVRSLAEYDALMR